MATAYPFIAPNSDLLFYALLPGSLFVSLILFMERDPFFLLIISQSLAFAIVYGFFWVTFKGLRDDGR